jgi:predicted DNA-binding protein (MmcQ/YjbR family)
MTIEILGEICKGLPGVTSDIKWGYDLCYNIGGKMFLVTGVHDAPIGASFKVNAEEFEEISTRKGFEPAPYLARHHWVRIDDISRLSRREWEHFIKDSYLLVRSKLPKKMQNELGKI